MLIFGIIGYFLKKLDYEPAPLVLALVLGPMFEKALVQSLRISYGSPWVFLTRPISLGLLITVVLFSLVPYLTKLKQKVAETGFKE
jgi:putative tricarboxylic transport membrane protein